MNKKKAVRRISIPMKSEIHNLVKLTKNFLPMSTYKDQGVTFKSVFKESRVDAYLVGESKTQQLLSGWENVLRYHKNLPYTLIRKIVPAGIDYRRNHQRNPINRGEIDRLIQILSTLGIDMSKELTELEIDESVPEIKVPPAELIKRLENHPLHSEVGCEVLTMFKNGHFNESVRKASEKFEAKVQGLSGRNEIGKDLMGKVFNINNPIIPINSLSTKSEKAIQEGYQFMTMGLMLGIRNIFSHGNEVQRKPEECFEMLMFINWLFRPLAITENE